MSIARHFFPRSPRFMMPSRQKMSPLVRGIRRRPSVPVQTAAEVISKFHPSQSMRLSSKGMCRFDTLAFDSQMGASVYISASFASTPKTQSPHPKSLFCGHAIPTLASICSGINLQCCSTSTTSGKTFESSVSRSSEFRASPCRKLCTTI